MTVMEAWTQIAFRYRDDDESETLATWRQAINTDDTLETDTTFRIRIGVQGAHTGGAGSFDLSVQFQSQLNTDGWNNITTSSAVVKAVASADTSWTITDDDATTEQLAQSQTFVAGHMDETGSTTAVNLSETEETECELVFQIVDTDVSGGDSVGIRIIDGAGVLDTYTETPSITVASSAVVVKGGSLLLALTHHPNARVKGSRPPTGEVVEVVLIYTKMLTGIGR